MRDSVRLLILAQLILWAFLFICFLLIPHYLLERNEGGLSNYGVYARTIVPYTLAFGLCGLLSLQAARVLSPKIERRRELRWMLAGFGWLCLFVLESTYLYQVNGVLDDIHIVAGIVLFVFETAAALWLGWVYPRDWLQDFWLVVQLFGFILSVLTFAGHLHILFIAEIMTGLGFGVLLAQTAKSAFYASTSTKSSSTPL